MGVGIWIADIVLAGISCPQNESKSQQAQQGEDCDME